MIIQSCRYHRNGVAGAGFYALRLTWKADRRTYSGSAIVFDEIGHVAVVADDGTGFRCEDFEDELRTFVDSAAGQDMAFGDWVQA